MAVDKSDGNEWNNDEESKLDQWYGNGFSEGSLVGAFGIIVVIILACFALAKIFGA